VRWALIFCGRDLIIPVSWRRSAENRPGRRRFYRDGRFQTLFAQVLRGFPGGGRPARIIAPVIKIAPSILSADFAALGHDIARVEAGGADQLHVDVMDGRFVPNITVGPVVVAAIRKRTRLPLDVHLMIVEPERYISEFVAAGADMVTVHAEACPHLARTLAQIRELGAMAGVALNPATPPDALRYVLDDLDLVLVMSVNPGFGGQAFIPSAHRKIRDVRALLGGRPVDVSVDGGVKADLAKVLADDGASTLVAGSAIFGAADPAAAVRALRDGATAP
jgi:ribulose-phosphate 3-epimerase